MNNEPEPTPTCQGLERLNHNEPRDDSVCGCNGVDDVSGHALGVEQRLGGDPIVVRPVAGRK